MERDYFSARGAAAGNLLVLSKMLDAHEQVDLDPPFYNATVVRTGLPVAIDACNAVLTLCHKVSRQLDELLAKEGVETLPESLRRPLLADLKLFSENFRHVSTLASEGARQSSREDLGVAYIKSRFQAAHRDFSKRFLKYSAELEVLDEEVRIGRELESNGQNSVEYVAEIDNADKDLRQAPYAKKTPARGNRGDSDNEGESLRRMMVALDRDTARIIAIADKKGLAADARLRAIAVIDARFYGKQSPELATLLNVSEAAIRATEWWKVDRKRYLKEEEMSRR